VVEFLLQGTLVVTWNAVTTKGSHQIAACQLAQAITHTFEGDPLLRENFIMAIGLASGPVRCGTVGTNNMKRFVIMGGVVESAIKLMWMTAFHSSGSKILVDQRIRVEGANLKFRFLTIDKVQLGSNEEAVVVSELKEMIPQRGDEWMYELRAAMNNDDYQPYNEAFSKFFEGKNSQSMSLLNQMTSPKVDTSRLRELIESYPNHGGKYRLSLFASAIEKL